ncbi:nitrite reductase small subunit [Longimycelium tulufanense]|uniref:Nitrite reductase small subunit n=1 Tax=Longimycelium tulufanense TaxID=907463 RepID=A0A8J3CBK9_9PSEU|nr:nitrite reductase small subunit NirD [Longimycelium tulufanense]GGM42280.1 nitrite reductase small subunit [Longimycelium tulufanense]
MTAVAENLTWTPVCQYAALEPENGVAALLPDGTQIALFRVADGTAYAVSNLDPFSQAMVLARGIVGDRGGVPMVASPMHKQAFDLRTGQCLDNPETCIPTYPVRVADGMVEVAGR